jgi:putative hydrolase of the HAD superfamily
MAGFVLPANVGAVFFDAVGTVIHPSVGAPAVYARTAERFGLAVTADEVSQRFVAAYLAEERADESAGWTTSEEREVARWQAIVRAALPGAPAGCFEALYDHFAGPDAWTVPAEAVELFDRLTAAGLALGLASNYDSRLRRVLAGRPELAPLGRRVVISSEVGVRKPGAGFFGRVVEAAGCPASDIAFIGDDLDNDFHGAAAAGMVAVLLDPHDRHPAVQPRVRSLAELTFTA